jgi:hypothetical protein
MSSFWRGLNLVCTLFCDFEGKKSHLGLIKPIYFIRANVFKNFHRLIFDNYFKKNVALRLNYGNPII